MSQSLLVDPSTKNDKSINLYFAISLLVHLIAVLSYLYMPESLKDLFFNKPNLIIREYVQVDLVGMPKLTKKELEKLPNQINHDAKIVKKLKNVTGGNETNVSDRNDNSVNQASSDDNNEVNKKSPKVDLTNFLSSMAQKKVVKRAKRSDKGKKKKSGVKYGQNLNRLERLALEGNALSKGSVAVGNNVGFSNDDYQIYLSSIPSQVRPYWKIPSYLSGKELKARIKIRIDSVGRIISMDVIESSGVEEFDQRALASIKSVKIFSAPSKSISEFLAIKGVVLGFPL